MERIHTSLSSVAYPLQKSADLDRLLDEIGSRRFVMIGEASHGTSEFYAWRAALSRRLIEEKGFDFVAVEGDWPACYEVNRYVKAYPGAAASAQAALQAFTRWPSWMWANHEVAQFITWLEQYNKQRHRHVGFYGLDVYSLWESLAEVSDYLEINYPELTPSVQAVVQCFDPYNQNEFEYARRAALLPKDCENAVVHMLSELHHNLPDGHTEDPEANFNTKQNAAVVAGAEHYYRATMQGNDDSWNVRDRHMMDTLDQLVQRYGEKSKAIVWAHNTHVGDARYTDMAADGLINIGQLTREKYPDETYLVGLVAIVVR